MSNENGLFAERPYVDAKSITDMSMGGNFNMNTKKIVNLAAPGDASDMATKAYADSAS